MTTSGQTEFSTNGSQIITDAYLTCGAIDLEGAPSAAQYEFGLRMLNRMIKQWQTRGVALHFFQDIVIPLVQEVPRYVLGFGQSSPNINIARPMRAVTALRRTYTAFATSKDTKTLTVASTAFNVPNLANAPFSTGQTVNIDTPAGNSATGTVTSVAGTVLTINITTVVNSASASYWLIYVADQNIIDTELMLISRNDYTRLSSKANQGDSTQGYFDRQSTYSVLNVWPTPADSLSSVLMTIERQVQIFVDDGDTPDFPVEIELALVYGLAAILCKPLTIPLQESTSIKQEADNYFSQLLTTDQETTSFFFQPDMRSRR